MIKLLWTLFVWGIASLAVWVICIFASMLTGISMGPVEARQAVGSAMTHTGIIVLSLFFGSLLSIFYLRSKAVERELEIALCFIQDLSEADKLDILRGKAEVVLDAREHERCQIDLYRNQVTNLASPKVPAQLQTARSKAKLCEKEFTAYHVLMRDTGVAVFDTVSEHAQWRPEPTLSDEVPASGSQAT